MKAVRIHRFGGPDVLSLDDVPMPEPQQGEVVIRVHAASVNPVDYKIRDGGYLGSDKLPITMGRDVSGTILRQEGQGGGFKVGDAVCAMLSPDQGGYAEYVLAKTHELAPKPARLDHVQAAAVPLAALTAWQGLFDHGGLHEGQRVLIHGAAGGVGHFAVQFAKARGATVYATAGTRDQEFVRGLGADAVIDYKTERFEDRARGIDIVFDLIGGETQDRSWSVLKPNGIIVSTLTEPKQDLAKQHKARGVRYMAQPNGQQLREIGDLIEAGRVRPEVTAVLPLAEAAQAQQRLEHEHPRGKIVLRVAA